VGALAHDVRGPLTSIRGFARLLQDARTTPDESAGFVEEIVLASDRIITMVRHLLDAALLGVPSVQDQMSCDLKDTVAKAMSDLRGTALEKAIQLELRVSGSPCPIKVSAITLYRSVLNLIDNAIKYSPRESTVHVELIFEDEKVTVKVRDEGKGIGEEDMPHIFDRYFRAHEAGSKAHGVGLGLALVKATANSYGGGVSVRNMEGQGAEFAITLPGTLQVK
jgi:signal transduction histidine kinase